MNKKSSIKTVAENLSSIPSKSDIEIDLLNRTVVFSTEGSAARPKRYFTLTFSSILKSFKDIEKNIKTFSSKTTYKEDVFRPIFDDVLSDPCAHTIAATQTKPFFSLLSKLTSAVNELIYTEGQTSWETDAIEDVILFLESAVPTESHDELPEPGRAIGGSNVLFYGAPGTGKSHEINDRIIENRTVRTVFHAESQNSDFCGSLKPRMKGTSVTYEFRPGPFTQAVTRAIENPKNMYYLVIEEINRAPAAAVFGEVFQLLDREDDTGRSVYSIDVTDPDMLLYINTKIPSPLRNNKLRLPSNLSIFASMNSSDQAVMPLDTAFKRRWNFEYIPLDFTSAPIGFLSFIDDSRSEQKITWSHFARTVNTVLAELEVAEDKHLGPFFLKQAELASEKSSSQALTGKLFIYLWDDVLRHDGRTEVFSEDAKTYGNLIEMYKEKKPVFSSSFFGKVRKHFEKLEDSAATIET